MPSATASPLTGRALGVVFFAFFGSAWLSVGLAATHQLTPFTGLLVGTGLLLLVLLAGRVIRPARRRSAPAAGPGDAGRARRQWRVFGWVNAGQWGGIFLAAWLLPRLGRADYFMPVLAGLVGLHLFPLARLFRYAPHALTGGALLLWAAGCVLLLPPTQWPAAVALGTGGLLWGSAGYTLWQARPQRRS